MNEVQDKTVLNKLKEKEKGVCLITCYDMKKQVHVFGTGFHFGSGWVMSAAHNFQADSDLPEDHSLLQTAKIGKCLLNFVHLVKDAPRKR